MTAYGAAVNAVQMSLSMVVGMSHLAITAVVRRALQATAAAARTMMGRLRMDLSNQLHGCKAENSRQVLDENIRLNALLRERDSQLQERDSQLQERDSQLRERDAEIKRLISGHEDMSGSPM